MRGRLGILPNLGILSMVQIVAQLLNMWALVYLARKLGTEWFGVVQFGVAVSAYSLILAEGGLWALGIREVARLDSPSAVRRYASRHMGVMVGLAGLVLVAGLLILPRFRIWSEDPWIPAIYLGLVLPQIFMLDWVGLGLERMFRTGLIKICRSLFYAILVLVVLRHVDGWLGWPAPRWVPVMFAVGFLLSNLLMARQLNGWLGGRIRPRWGGRLDAGRRLAAAAPIGLGNVALRVTMGIDLIILALFCAEDVVGSYAAAAKILVVLITGTEVLWKALLPRLSRQWRDSPSEFGRRLALYLGLVWVAFLPVAWGGLAVGRELMEALFGEGYGGAGPVFRILSFSYVALALGMFFGNALIACDRQREFLPPRLGAAAVAVVGCLVLVPRLGPLGACRAMLAAHVLLAVWTGWLCRAFLSRALVLPLLGATLAGGSMYLVVGMLPAWSLWARIAAGAVVYGAVVAPVGWVWLRRVRGGSRPL